MKKLTLLLIIFFGGITQFLHAQLLPSIGLNSLPANNEPVCNIPWYLGSFYTSGLSEGSTAHDFKLYNLNGDSLVLSEKLALGKPVLLVAGSLTCPVFMNKIATINQIISTYGNQLQVFVIYTLEAHPTDTSVYFGYVNVGTANQNAGILFPQPTTFGERKAMVDTLPNWGNCSAQIFIDGPCNEWWTTFGPAPNNAYLIDTNGTITAKHGWFHKNSDNIFCDIDSLLGTNSGLCNTASGNGQFLVQVLNQTSSGATGNILYDYANLINTSTDPVTLGIKKLQQTLPANWQTAFCADVCYSPNEDSITLVLSPNDTLLFSLDFITSAQPDSGSVKVGFRNVNDITNNFQTTFRAMTYPLFVEAETAPEISLYPNPVQDVLQIRAPKNFQLQSIYSVEGKSLLFTPLVNKIDMSSLPRGIYFLRFQHNQQHWVKKVTKF